MDAELEAKIRSLLDQHRIMTVATLRPDGWPQATTVGYVNEGMAIYFSCGRDSQKARNLAHDDRVSLTIDHDVPAPTEIAGLSMAARARLVDSTDEIRRAMLQMLPRKYPEYAPMMQGVNLDDVAVFRVSPEVISVLDYSKGFGHTDLVRPDAV
jgi:nitroimidazol reductase NimA-like FMN-containing flavoprotein (pyridoxamine 5'-phosphate oxidase superfamily)